MLAISCSTRKPSSGIPTKHVPRHVCPLWVKGRHRLTIGSSLLYSQERTSSPLPAARSARGHDHPDSDARPRSPSGPNHLTLSSSSVQALTLMPLSCGCGRRSLELNRALVGPLCAHVRPVRGLGAHGVCGRACSCWKTPVSAQAASASVIRYGRQRANQLLKRRSAIPAVAGREPLNVGNALTCAV
jgi:hypothetical protein